MVFLVRNLPEPYSHENIIFRIVDVQESVESGKWITTITAGIMPLRESLKQRLGTDANFIDNTIEDYGVIQNDTRPIEESSKKLAPGNSKSKPERPGGDLTRGPDRLLIY